MCLVRYQKSLFTVWRYYAGSALAISWTSDSSCSCSNTSSLSIKISLSVSSSYGMFNDDIEPRVSESLSASRIISKAAFLFLASFNGCSFGLLVEAELVVGLPILSVSGGISVKIFRTWPWEEKLLSHAAGVAGKFNMREATFDCYVSYAISTTT